MSLKMKIDLFRFALIATLIPKSINRRAGARRGRYDVKRKVKLADKTLDIPAKC